MAHTFDAVVQASLGQLGLDQRALAAGFSWQAHAASLKAMQALLQKLLAADGGALTQQHASYAAELIPGSWPCSCLLACLPSCLPVSVLLADAFSAACIDFEAVACSTSHRKSGLQGPLHAGGQALQAGYSTNLF